MIDWMNQTDAQHVGLRNALSEARADIKADIAEHRERTSTDMSKLGLAFATLHADIAAHREQMSTDIAKHREQTSTDMSNLRSERAELPAAVREVRAEMKAQFAEVNGKLDGKCAEINGKFAEVNARFTTMESAAAQRHAEFMKWTIGFWLISLVTLVGAIATFARMLNRP